LWFFPSSASVPLLLRPQFSSQKEESGEKPFPPFRPKNRATRAKSPTPFFGLSQNSSPLNPKSNSTAYPPPKSRSTLTSEEAIEERKMEGEKKKKKEQK
jgi:hypothetical protein